jgi:membrane associated rhomboid family serine protease
MQSTPDAADLIDVFSSPDQAACMDRAFMLGAVNIPARIDGGPTRFVVQVPHRFVAFAMHHLWQYEQELRRRPLVAPPARPMPHAWLGSLVYVVLMALVSLAVVRGWWGPDAFMRGALSPAEIRAGEWWRALTALTLHLDIVHLVMNLGAGAAIGLFASRQLGPGHAWLLTVLAAAGANLLKGMLGAASHLSVGASTAVFAALGLVSAHAWQLRGAYAPSWARRAAPLVAGIVLLGLLGSGGPVEDGTEHTTDLVAHVLGFAAGVALGVAAAQPRVAALLQRLPQTAAGVAAVGLLCLGWVFALSR